MKAILLLLLFSCLTACTTQERNRLPQPQDGNGAVIDLRNDGYFERLNVPPRAEDRQP